MKDSPHLITLGGGCFWCTEAVFLGVRGVQSVQSGYCNGHVNRPSYEQVCTGQTGHNEVVRVQWDPQQISLDALLQIFFLTHDPTTLNRQGNDVGTQYRSGIYTHSPAQLAEAQAFVAALSTSGAFKQTVVTEVMPEANYWPAEDYHQNYFAQHPNQGYCAFVVAPKVEKFRKTFAQYALA
jgi:peptide-methionine (S)-S-oxide reductase